MELFAELIVLFDLRLFWMQREMRCLVRIFLKQSLPHNLERGRKEKVEKTEERKSMETSLGSVQSCSLTYSAQIS